MKTLTPDQGESSIPHVVNEQQQVKGLLRTFIALRHRNFRLFWFGQLISLIGTWMQTTAQAWLVLQLTHSAWLLGVVGALQFLPVMFLSLFGGVLADRLPKRKVLLFTQSSAMLQAFVLWVLVATGTVQIWHILLLASLLGLTNSVDMPTRQAFVAEMVGREHLPNAIALNSSQFNMARILGPGLGGLLIAWLGLAPLFLLNAISFIAVIVGLALITMKDLYAQAKRSPSQKVPQGFGFISSAFGLGSLFSALWLAWGNNRPSIKRLLTGSFAFCVLEILFAISHLYMLSLILIAAVGFVQIAFTTTANTTLQTVAPDYLRGRVMSAYMLVFAGTIPLGNLFTGGIAHLFGAPIALLAGAAISLLAATVGWILRKPAEKSLAEALPITS